MGLGDTHGRAKVDPRSPQAFGVCDDCGEWNNLVALRRQNEWAGTQLTWQGTLVCRRCIAKPQPQLRAIKLPPDPVPVKNPRPESSLPGIDYPFGFTQYSMWPDGMPLPQAVYLTDGLGNNILNQLGQPIQIEIGSDGMALLTQLSVMTDIPVPGTINNQSGKIAARSVSQVMLAAAARSYIAIFNPCNVPMWVNVGAAAGYTPPCVVLGSGSCLFWATAQGIGVPTALEIDVISPIPGVPYYCYSAP